MKPLNGNGIFKGEALKRKRRNEMSVVIIGGNECMVRKYKDLCEEYNCRAKVFVKMISEMKNKIGSPDLIVLFTNTVSHKMARCALSEARVNSTVIVKSHSSSASALKGILDVYAT